MERIQTADIKADIGSNVGGEIRRAVLFWYGALEINKDVWGTRDGGWAQRKQCGVAWGEDRRALLKVIFETYGIVGIS